MAEILGTNTDYLRWILQVKYRECPMCHQTLVDLSDNPAFVNHNPPKDVQGAYNEHTRANSSNPSVIGSSMPASNSSGASVCNESMVRGEQEQKRKQSEGPSSNEASMVKFNFPISERNIPQEGNLRKDKGSKDSKKRKLRYVWEEWW